MTVLAHYPNPEDDMADRFMQQAFDMVCENAKAPESHYVCLMETVQRYRGPEEGGWWTPDTELVRYKEYPTRELAEAAAAEVRKLADELSQQARREHGRHCQESMDWLNARGLEADFLTEPDGPETYSVRVTESIPENSYGATQYE